jgi:copper transport protein
VPDSVSAVWLRVRRGLLGTSCALLVLSGVCVGPARAHAVLESTSPAAGSVVDAVPGAVVLTFDEAVRPAPAAIEVLDPDGRRINRPASSGIAASVRIPLLSSTVRGTYLVRYAVVSDDNHRIGAAFTFVVGAASGSGPAGYGVADDERKWPDVVAPVLRWIDYTGLALLVGALLAMGLNWPLSGGPQMARRLQRTGLMMVAVGAIGELGCETLSAAGGRSAFWSELTDRSGVAHLSRCGLALALPTALGLDGSSRRRGRSRVELLLVALVATYPLAGHPAGTSLPVISLAADGLHVAAMSLWLGGLIVLAAFVLPHASPADLGRVVPLWSDWAGYAVATVLLTGITQALLQLGSPGQLLDTGYGRLVLIKAGLLAAVLLVAAGSRRWVTTTSRPGARPPPAAGRLRWRVAVESVGILVILAVTSVLVQTAPARTAAATGPAAVAIRLAGPRALVQGSLTPGRAGLNRIDLHAVTPDGRPAQIRAWSATLTQPGRPNVGLRLLAITPDHALGQLRLPDGGPWRITLTVLDAGLRPSTMSSTVILSD